MTVAGLAGSSSSPVCFLTFFFVADDNPTAYPLDTVRRRMMLTVGEKQKVYSGTIDALTKILRAEGVKAVSNQLVPSRAVRY